MKSCLIFSGGSINGNEYLPNIDNNTLVISADGGYLNTLKFNIIPDICMGDFDTLTIDINPSCKIIKYPPEKDDTDTMLCVKKAISMGYDNIYIYGALGGRFDHTIANIQTLEYITERNITAYIVDNQNIITMQKDSTKDYNHYHDFRYFSIFSVSESSEVSAIGLKYPLENTILNRNFPLGVSNEILLDSATITVHKGTILVVYSKD